MDALAIYRESVQCTLDEMRSLPAGVADIAASADCNAGDTMIELGRKHERFTNEFSAMPTEAYLAFFISTLESILACDDSIPAEARAWFESRGVRF